MWSTPSSPMRPPVTARVSSGSGNIRITLKDIRDRDYSQMDDGRKAVGRPCKREDARHVPSYSSQSSFGGRRAQHAGAVCIAGHQPRKTAGSATRSSCERVYENPVFQMADVDLKFSKPEARIEHQPRQGRRAMGVSTKQHCPDPAIRFERPAHGILLHERQAIRDLGRNQPPATQPAGLPGGAVHPQRRRRHDPARQPGGTGLRHGSPEAVPLQPLRVGYRLGRTGRRENHRAGAGRDGQDSRRGAGRNLPHSPGGRLEGLYARVPPA